MKNIIYKSLPFMVLPIVKLILGFESAVVIGLSVIIINQFDQCK